MKCNTKTMLFTGVGLLAALTIAYVLVVFVLQTGIP